MSPGDENVTLADLKPPHRGRRREFYLMWLAVLVTYGIGDTLTTIAGVVFSVGIEEANPLVALGLARFGIAGFLAIKLAVMIVLFALSTIGSIRGEKLTYYGLPILAIVLGIFLTASNLQLILGGI